MTLTHNGRELDIRRSASHPITPDGFERAIQHALAAPFEGMLEFAQSYNLHGTPVLEDCQTIALYISIRRTSPAPGGDFVGRCPVHGIVDLTGAQLKTEGFTCPSCWSELSDVRD